MKLNDLKIGDNAIIKDITSKDDIKNRFLDLGITKGTKIVKVLENPGGNMCAYNIKGSIIAIRKSDSMDITVE